MYKSKEIRWFTTTEDKQITGWFKAQGINFETTESRTDYYLPLPDKEEMNIKLREGKIEIKQRSGESQIGKLTKTAEGYFENWVKWSFDADIADPLSKAIIEEKKYNWIEIWKKRIGVKLTPDANGKTKVVSIKEHIPYGCQIEYTRIVVHQKEYFSFALEWFGEKILELDYSLLEQILGDNILKREDSMGYSKFLKQV